MKIVYIDCQNTHMWVKDLGREIDRKKFFVYLKDKLHVDQVKLFVGYVSWNEQFYDMLTRVWYIIVHKVTWSYIAKEKIDNKRVKKTSIKWNVDSELILESARDYYEWWLTKWYLVSWDWDFVVLINFWKEKWIFGKLFTPNPTKTSILLKQSAWNDLISLKYLQAKISR